ncbi:MAG: TetR/AcrR family transcriptional regulator C-terminal domain-containing protein [Chloroflexota bacterium]|nr:TetR/AcrR family transcriptional regulator C-terminal domain-containing protein [Chloroflexota bacterium]
MAVSAPPAGRHKAHSSTGGRQHLNRRRVLDAARALVDREGVAELTIRRLGLELGVEGMSLYKHVADKDAVLDGIVELLWAEVPASPDPAADWRDALRELAQGLRDLVHRHPKAAPLLVSRNFINASALRCWDAYLQVLQRAGFERQRALDAICAVGTQGLGYGLMELRCLGSEAESGQPETQIQRLRRVTRFLPADLPDSLVELAMDLSGQCDFDRCFKIAVDAVLGGLAP